MSAVSMSPTAPAAIPSAAPSAGPVPIDRRRWRDLPAWAGARMTPGGRPDDAGMTTAEYAVGTVAACGFSGLLYKLLTSPEVLGLLRDVITKAFRLGF